MYILNTSRSRTRQVQFASMVYTVLALPLLFVADLSSAQSQQLDEEKIVLEGATVPDHHAYQSLLTSLISFRDKHGEEVAVGIVMSELNHNPIPDEGGGFTLYNKRDPEFLSDEETKQVAARLLAAAEIISSSKEREKKEILCPSDRPYPQGEAAYRALDLLEGQEETIVSANYNEMLAGFRNKEAQGRLQNWIERLKPGIRITISDTEAVLKNSGRNAEYLIQQYCLSTTAEGL